MPSVHSNRSDGRGHYPARGDTHVLNPWEDRSQKGVSIKQTNNRSGKKNTASSFNV